MKNARIKTKSSRLALLFFFLVGCTKTVPFKEEVKLETQSKDTISQGVDYLMVASQSKGSMSSPESFPYSFAENKRVQLRFTKDSLIIEEKEKDARFQGNETNNKTVLEIPVDHLDYRCSQDKYGECTNKEEVNNDIDWSKKKYFKLKGDSFKAAQIEALPIIGDFCYEEVSSRVVGTPELTPEAINFEIEKSFVESCSARDLAETNVKARYHYSLVRTDTVLTPGFKTLSYSENDKNTYGFFNTERVVRDTDLNETEAGKISIMNHWNPNREKIDYYLSDEFAKPENSAIKDLTYKTVTNINLGLEQAGAKFRINLHEPAGKVPGDIRNSMIILVEDPLASSVIGYGPQTEDPVTGEIISARTTMFLGTIKAFVKYTYEDIVRAKHLQNLSAAKSAPPAAGDTASGPAAKFFARSKNAAASMQSFSKPISYVDSVIAASRPMEKASSAIPAKSSAMINKEISKLSKDPTLTRDQMIMSEEVGYQTENLIPEYITDAGLNDSAIPAQNKSVLAKYNYLKNVKNCAFSPPYDVISHSFELKLADLFPGQELKPWENLSASEKQDVIDALLPDVWVATLIHELGHNLGLRHNFEGSEDKANFYTQEEIKALNEKVGSAGFAQQNEAYSNSVMEYIDDLKALKHLGRYDIAALRFAYKNEIEVVKTESVKNPETGKIEEKILDSQFIQADTIEKVDSILSSKGLGAKTTELDACASNVKTTEEYLACLNKFSGYKVRPIKFCTDDSTGINAGCRRHDVGTSNVEIVKNLIEQYKNAYEYRNYRRDRVDFSLMTDAKYASRIGQIFYDIRLMMEVAERLNYRGYPYSSSMWQKNAGLKDIRDAAKIGGEFLLSVLQVPDKICAFAKKDDENDVIIRYLTYFGEARCENINSKDYNELKGYALLAQAGRSFNSLKDPNSKNPYADQIDVRGYWIDKMMAARYLLYRQVGVSNLDAHGDSYLDLPELRDSILKTLTDIALDQLVVPVEFEFVTGEKQTMPFKVDTIDSMRVAKPIHPRLARRLGVPFEPFYMTEYLNQFAAHEITNFTDKDNSEKNTAQIFKVAAYDTRTGNIKLDGKNKYSVLDVGSQRFVAAPENAIAVELMKAAQETKDSVRLVKSLDSKLLQTAAEVMGKADADTKPEKLVADIVAAAGLKANDNKIKALQKLVVMNPSEIKLYFEKSESDILNQDSSVQKLRMLKIVY